MAATKNFTISAGATFEFTLLYKDSAGVAIDITGWLFQMKAKRTFSQNEVPALSINETDGIAVTGAEGRLDVTISAARTDAIRDAWLATSKIDGYYELLGIDPGGKAKILLSGKLTVIPGVI